MGRKDVDNEPVTMSNREHDITATTFTQSDETDQLIQENIAKDPGKSHTSLIHLSYRFYIFGKEQEADDTH